MRRKPSKLRLAWTAARLASRQALSEGAAAKDRELSELLTGQLDDLLSEGVRPI